MIYFKYLRNSLNMRNLVIIALVMLVLTSYSTERKEEAPIFKKFPAFQSQYIGPRNVEIMLPPGYDPELKYDVLYMHDGQNVFDPFTAYAGVDWGVDEQVVKLQNENKIRPVIVVVSWCTEKRFFEYMPNKPVQDIKALKNSGKLNEDLLSDNYLKFIINELKPFVDKNFNTYQTPDHTFIMGSSMGGLISCYAICEYPEVFGGAACLSTHWPAYDGIFLKYIKDNLPDPSTHKIYFDYGTVTLDSLYEPYQKQADEMMKTRGFMDGKNWVTRKFEGAAHNENAWNARVNIPIEFFLGKQ